MRVLAVSTSSPYPPDDALRYRTAKLLRYLADDADVTLLTWDAPGHARPKAPDGAGLTETVRLPAQVAPRSMAARLRRRARQWSGDVPAHLQEMLEQRGLRGRGAGRDRLVRAVRARHLRAPFDVVVYLDEEATRLGVPDLGVPAVVHRLNVFEAAIGPMMRSPAWRALWALERHVWRRYDRCVLEGASLVFSPTDESAAALRPLVTDAPVVVLPNGVDLPERPVDPAAGRAVVFVGWMGYHPNVDAVTWFADACWPDLGDRFPESTFRIVGREPTEAVRRLAGDGIEVTGTVADVGAACRDARVAVVPLRGGMGVKTKTLEAMALGLPVVTTSVGAEGLHATPGDGLLIADDARSLTAATAGLLADPARAVALGAAARRWVERHHTWSRAGDIQAEAMRSVVAPAGSGSGIGTVAR